MADAETMKKIDDGYKRLQSATKCESLLRNHLTEGVKNRLKDKRTKLGATLWDVIQSGVTHLDSRVGVYAPDAESYTVFKELFDPVIQEYHIGFKSTDTQPAVDFGEGKIGDFVDLDPDGKTIEAIKIRCCRSLVGYPFHPCLNEANYKEIEVKMKGILEKISDPEFRGKYYPLATMAQNVQNDLFAEHLLFAQGDRFLQAANACRYWPTGRGIFHNNNKTFLVWVNEEDHLRIISRQNGGNVGQAFKRLIRGVKVIQSKVAFLHDNRLGWLTFCPTNLGTTIRASAYVKIPRVAARPDFKSLCEDLKLQPRGVKGEHSDLVGGVFDISNKIRLGISEYSAVKIMYDGVKKLMELEKAATDSDAGERPRNSTEF